MKKLVKTLSRLPLKVHYGFANGVLYPLAYYVLRYRRKIVYQNLRNSFPDKSDDEIKAIAKGFYHHLADTVAEIIYGYTISPEEMNQRVQYQHIDLLEKRIKDRGYSFNAEMTKMDDNKPSIEKALDNTTQKLLIANTSFDARV